MGANNNSKKGATEVHQPDEIKEVVSGSNEKTKVMAELEQRVHATLETYSNVHRGSGYNSMVSTHLFEQARDIALEYLGLSKGRYVVIFCTPRRAEILIKQLKPGSYQSISSREFGLSLGIRVLAVKRRALRVGISFQTGGGTTKLISQEWVIWANAPDRFEAGTPAIVNVIAFAKALRLVQKYGKAIFMNSTAEKLTIAEILYHDELDEYTGKELLDKLRHTLIGSSIRVPTVEGIQPYVNLDNSASTPTFSSVWNTFRQTFWQTLEVKQEIIHEVRSVCAKLLGAPQAAYDVIFTSNTTEAINLAAESLGREVDEETSPVVLNSLLEHSSNDLPWRMVPGCTVIRLSVDDDGFMDLDELETLLCEYNQKSMYGKKRIKLVAVSGASNVLGVCNNIAEISRIVHKYGAQLLIDAAQLIAHRKIDMEASGIDYLAFSAHKVYAPFGCGVLVAKKGLLNFSSAELEQVRSSGEENAGGVAALGKAIVILQRIGMDLIKEEEQALTRLALNRLSEISGLKIYGIKKPDSQEFAQKLGVIVFELKGMMANRVASELSIQGGIGVRHGCLCSHIIIKRLLKFTPTAEQLQRLFQILFPKARLPGLVRVSLGIENGEEDVDRLIHSLNKIIKNPKGTSTSKEYGTPNLTKADVKKQMNDLVRDSALSVFS